MEVNLMYAFRNHHCTQCSWWNIEQCKYFEFSTYSLNTSQNNVHIVNECKELRRIVNVVWLTITPEKCVEREKLIFYILRNWTASEPVFSSCTSSCAAAFILEYWLVSMGMGRMGHLPTHFEICKDESYPENVTLVSATKQENPTSISAFLLWSVEEHKIPWYFFTGREVQGGENE